MSDLVNLKSKTEKLSVLYVEDSAILLKRMSTFLEHLFKEVYQAKDGREGLKSYKLNKPDIIITDLNMPVMSGHEMIKNLKQIDPEVNIIVLSAYSDTENLLESIHLGVVDFVPKPVDSKLLQEILLKVATKASKKQPPLLSVEEQNIKINEEMFKKLEILYKSHTSIEFINHYKGVPILNKGVITTIDTNTVSVEVPFFQAFAMRYEGKTVLDSELFENSIEAKVEKVHSYNNNLKLKDLQYLNCVTTKRKQLRVEPDEHFSAVISYKNQILSSQLEYIAIDFASLIIKSDELDFHEGDELTIEFIIETDTKKVIETKAEVYIIDTNHTQQNHIMVLFELDNTSKNLLEAYLEERRLDLIVEFKQLNKS